MRRASPLPAAAFTVISLTAFGQVGAARPEFPNAVHLETQEEQHLDGSISSGRPLSAPASLLMLSARGVSQLSQHASAAIASLGLAPSPSMQYSSQADAPGALLDVTDGGDGPTEGAAPVEERSSCGPFGVLNYQMTVVDLDADGGCVAGQEYSNVLVHFVGGADCQPPEPVNGCHRYVIARYSQSCDLAPVKPFMRNRNSELFKDGVYRECYEAPFLESRTVYTKGAPGVDRCDWEYCENEAQAPKSGARKLCATSMAFYATTVILFHLYA